MTIRLTWDETTRSCPHSSTVYLPRGIVAAPSVVHFTCPKCGKRYAAMPASATTAEVDDDKVPDEGVIRAENEGDGGTSTIATSKRKPKKQKDKEKDGKK